MKDMFCFQCQQTAHNTGCEGNAGVCGKKCDTANYQDELTGALIGLARAAKSGHPTDNTHKIILEGLFTTITNVNFYNDTIKKLTAKIHQERARINAEKFEDYDMKCLWEDNEDIRSLKSLILFGIRGMAAYGYHAMALGKMDEEVNQFFYEALYAIGEDLRQDELLPLVLKTGEVNFKCMALLDEANTSAYGTPVPNTVSLTIEKGPFIVVSGHDLHDLKLLLEQTKDKGINIYTHSEMLPAHGYPELKKYPHLKGNFGTAWQSQQFEFHNIPAPILFTTNCLMPVRESYKDRVFTTSVVSFPELVHIGEDKDFTPVIQRAIECGGYEEDTPMTGINKGTTVTTGYAHGTVLSIADKVIDAVKSGKISHFFLVGGCDGAAPGRSYYTEFVKQAPKDSIILTAACGKYRFNDLDLGDIDGIPRLLDLGQCNDSYSGIKIALALADAFECGVNDLPLTLVLSWYEQKAVCILLTLLYLGIQNIYLGPTLPAFVSPNVLNILVENYNLTPISTPEQDLEKILA
ncbi:hydroxylamine reductase [Candidatus Galacturonibacter soehngenii]|uniref:Hydroxylamine reductase n=2 Tax=Candidatus Galacturonatibacter soehngenii TaxID=2307010 RepID=A0A7V7UDL4_9FIRM|nr:hydroxylamine reductase [Candidatus Galacturonibacter soehngenii]KAB1440697.1 hydroxylamine reductase [Candidatus Galacturonibacter soehngenii]